MEDRASKRTLVSVSLTLLLLAVSGCHEGRAAERFGKTFYLDGAGNWGFGMYDVPAGLKEAGYAGDVEIYIWTTSLMPLIDQLNIIGAKLRAMALTDRIKQYRRRYPDNDVNLIALSAGTGVLIWAVEGLSAETRVNNVVLLGSSLSHDYDVSRALERMTGRIYVYHSPHDEILSAVTLIGTIDGKRGVKSAGQVGLEPPAGSEDRVVNVPWHRRYVRFGWTGAHTDCTSKKFVKEVIAHHVMHRRGGETVPSNTTAGDARPGLSIAVNPTALAAK